ncbi:MAG: flagellar filament capping protein FliD [Phycisphaerales bacterium]
MASITSGVGLVSGINTAQLIQQLLAVEGKGKIPLQQRVADLTAQRTALLDVNSRLLNFQSAGSKFRISKVFQSTTAKSSDDTILTAAANTATIPGIYQLYVKRLVSANQVRSTGFASSTSAPLGLDSLKVEFGDLGVHRSLDLAALNGGEGVRRGKIVITDKSGTAATIDLSDATTLEEVVDRINDDSGVAVTASIKNERLVFTDSSGGSGQLKVANGTNSFAATDLGIVGTTNSVSLTSSQIYKLGASTSLQSLNDGNGVLIRDGVTDFKLQVGTDVYNISLGRKDAPITTTTSLSDLNNGAGIKINTTDAADFKVRTSTGQLVDINLGDVLDAEGNVDDKAVKTVGELLTRVNQTLATALGPDMVKMSLSSDGKGFVLTDTMGGVDPLRTLGVGPNGDKTAKDLGIFTGAAGGSGPVITGTAVPNKVDTPRAATIQDVIDRVKDQTAGRVTLSINGAGTGLQLSAADAITVLDGTTDGSSFAGEIGERTARDLGLFGGNGTSVTGTRVLAGASTLLVNTLNGGKGLDSSNSLTITDRSGNVASIGGLGSYSTLEQLIDALNDGAETGGVQAQFSISPDDMSITVTDTSGSTAGTLSIFGSAATALGIAGDGNDAGILRGKNFEPKHIGYASPLASLNYGKGIGTGIFKITDSKGESATVDIDASATTLYDVIQEINSRGLAVEARINDAGDGISLVDTNTGVRTVLMKVSDQSGGIASILGINKTASSLGANIEGSFEKVVDLDVTDSLTSVVSKLNAAGIPLSASIVNTGTGGKPFYLSLASKIGGRAGRMHLDTGGVDLDLTTISEGRDAELLFGNTDPASAIVLRSSSNVFSNVVGGLDITATKASTDLVTINVDRDTAGIKQAIKDFAAAFNDVVGRIDQYDSYDADTLKKGPLLGNPTLARARQVVYGTVQGRAKNVSGQFQYLSQIGLKVAKDGQLQFNEEKFDSAYATDPDAVEKLFVTYEQQTVSAETVSPGVTVGSSTTVTTALGFGDLVDQAMKSLTGPVDGVFTKASESFQNLIDRTNQRISDFDDKLARRQEQLQRQFNAMEEALSKLQGQQSALTSIFSSLKA